MWARVMPDVMLLLLAMEMPIIFAEVLDKESSIISVWAVFLIVALGGYFLCRFRWWLAGIVVPVALILSVIWLSELQGAARGYELGTGSGIPSCRYRVSAAFPGCCRSLISGAAKRCFK